MQLCSHKIKLIEIMESGRVIALLMSPFQTVSTNMRLDITPDDWN